MDRRKVLLSTCSECKGGVRAIVPETVDSDFTKEVKRHNLTVKSITMDALKKHKWCECNSKRSAENPSKKISNNPGGFKTLPSKANQVNWDTD